MTRPPVAVTLGLDERRLPAETFERISRRAGLIAERTIKREEAVENFGKPGRDVHELGGVLAGFARRSGWIPHLKLAALGSDWPSIVGPAIAAHTHVASYREGVLTIRADSPSWTTQLTYLIPQLTATIRGRLEGLPIESIRVTGPQSHGPGMRKRRYVQNNIRWR